MPCIVAENLDVSEQAVKRPDTLKGMPDQVSSNL